MSTKTGSVFVYYGSSDGLSPSSRTELKVTDSSRVFGAELASAGDMNGDGFADLLVAAPFGPAGGTGSRIHVFLGSAGGVGTSPYKSIQFDDYLLEGEGRVTEAFRLASVARGGADVNGDGYADFIVTSPQVSKLGSYAIFFGSANDVLNGAKAGPASGNGFGRAIAVCDLNGDRRTDLLVGSPEAIGSELTSTVKAYKGVAARLELAQELSAVGEGFFGGRVGCADFANDGYPDGVISDPAASAANLYGGDVLLHANAGGTITGTGRSLGGQLAALGAFSGDVLEPVGDMNGDGAPELVVGGGGWLRVMFAVRDPSASDYIEILNDPGSLGAASTVRVLGGDINGDGLSDLIVGSPAFEGHGRITIFRGSRTSRIVYPSTEYIDAPAGVTGFGSRLSAGL